jgi:hypothetical protein
MPKKDGEPRKGLYDCLAECCAGGCRILAGDMNMAFWGLIPELSDRGVEVRLIAHHAEWNIALERWQWDTCGIWVCGPMPKPGQCLTMTMHSRCGMIHPFALDGKANNRGYTGSCFNKTDDVPHTEDVVDEAVMRELSKYLRDRMRVYPSGAALAAHMPDLIPEDPVHALEIASKKTSRDAQKLTAKTLRSVGGACRQEAIAFGEQKACPQHQNAAKSWPTASSGTRAACSGAEVAIGLY